MIIIVPILFFQNCGKPGFNAETHGIISGSAVQSSVSAEPSILALDTPQNDIQPGTPFRVFANLSAYPGGTTYLWDSDFDTGLLYCEMTTSVDRSITDFECPSAGVITVKLTVILPDGGNYFYSLQIGVGGVVPTPTPTPVATPTPTPTATPGPGSTATPTPTPMLSDGAQLYNLKCSNCHGSLPGNSTKMNRTLTQLNNALTNVGAMQSISLTADQKTMIINALNSGGL